MVYLSYETNRTALPDDPPCPFRLIPLNGPVVSVPILWESPRAGCPILGGDTAFGASRCFNEFSCSVLFTLQHGRIGFYSYIWDRPRSR